MNVFLCILWRLSLMLLTDFQVRQAFLPHPLARTLHPKPPYPGCRWVSPFSYLRHSGIILFIILPNLFLLTFLTTHMAYIFKLPFFLTFSTNLFKSFFPHCPPRHCLFLNTYLYLGLDQLSFCRTPAIFSWTLSNTGVLFSCSLHNIHYYRRIFSYCSHKSCWSCCL